MAPLAKKVPTPALRGSTTRLNKQWYTHYSAVSSNAEAKYQLSTAWWNEWLAVHGPDDFCSTVQ